MNAQTTRNISKTLLGCLSLILIVTIMITGCGEGDDDNGTVEPTKQPTVEPTGEPTSEPAEDVVITIGSLTDLTGASAGALEPIENALDDMVKYYNEENLIPGVELKAIRYDTSYDPSKYISGYQWLKERDTDVFFAPSPGVAEIIRPRIEEDGMVLFSLSATREDLMPPGRVFLPATIPEDNAFTLLNWLAENDQDFPEDGPAKIGAVGWSTPYNMALHDAMEEYVEAHTDQFEWMGKYHTERSFTWGPEVRALKDCDYVMVPVVLTNFVKEYRSEGHTAKFIGTAAQAGFIGLVHDANLWEQIDGMVFFGLVAWWGDGTEEADFMEEILYRYRADRAEDIMRQGSGYGAVDGIQQVIEIIANAVEAVGPENYNSDALYEAAISYSQITSSGELRASFSETKRSSLDRLRIYEADGTAKDLFLMSDEFFPVVHEP
ncbi:MAG: ABC transporter substrate-binding protein [Chloroflexi bacterium]|nr:ABC transporter substrate-binding protein [Chloroflexota bacterium]